MMTVRRYHKGDEDQIQTLFKKTFNHTRPLAVWKWKFIENPKQERPFILVFEEDNQILGHISLWVTDAYLNGEKKKVGLRVDTMVDPDARGKGIYKKLNDALLVEAKQDGIDYLYGFPAPKAKELFLRYTGASHLTDMPRWMLIQKPIHLLASKFSPLSIFKPLDRIFQSFKKSKLHTDGYEVKEVKRCEQEFDQLAERSKHAEQGLVVRDAAYLNYRYFDHPEHQYKMIGIYEDRRLIGYVVTHQISGSFENGMLVDWLAEDEKLWPVLLAAARTELKDTDVIQSWALTHTLAASTLKQDGFIHKDSPMPLVGKAIDPSLSSMDDADQWFITPGDVDSY